MLKLKIKPPSGESAEGATPKLRINLSSLSAASNVKSSATGGTVLHNPQMQSQLASYFYGSASLEEQFILRLPPSLASILTQQLAENEFQLPGEGFRIKFISPRTAIVQHPRFVKGSYPAVLMDLPSICETLKSSNLTSIPALAKDEDGSASAIEEAVVKNDSKLDKSTGSSTGAFPVGQYYKTADVAQVLLVLDLDNPDGQKQFANLPQIVQQRLLLAVQGGNYLSVSECPDEQLATCSWTQLEDGLTRPLKNAHQRRFGPRPVHMREVGDLELLERELERLLKMDKQSFESQFTLYGPNGDVLLCSEGIAATAKAVPAIDEVMMDIEAEEEEVEGQDMEQAEDQEEMYDQDEDEPEDDDFDNFAAELEDNLLENQRQDQEIEPSEPSEHAPPSAPEVEETVQSPVLTERQRMVLDLQGKLQEKQRQASSVSNPLIKARIEDVIRQLEDNLRMLQQSTE